MSATSIAAYIVLFGSVGLLFLLVSLLVGRLVRPRVPSAAKLDVYECGEPAVGSSFVQFDLRFYVVALVFIVFEVELALFFPPATIFGTATRWMNPQAPPTRPPEYSVPAGRPPATSLEADVGVTNGRAINAGVTVTQPGDQKKQTSAPARQTAGTADPVRTAEDARTLALAAAVDLAAFFGLILLGFAYVWRLGDLDWVRAIGTSPSRSAQNLHLVP